MLREPLRPVILRSVLCFSALAAACNARPTHEVIAVTDLTPRQVEAGDRMVIHGSGFPLAADIRRVTVRLTGSLARPGLAPCPRAVTVSLADPTDPGSVTDPITGITREPLYAAADTHALRVEGGDRIEFTVTDDVLRALTTCPGEHASAPAPHATVSLLGPHAGVFVEVETVLGTTLSSGRPLRGPRVDVLTPWGRTLDAQRAAQAEAERALAFMGLTLGSSHPPDGGLQVDRVAPGSPADEAGLADGDVIERIDGASLLGVSDFRPAPGAELATLAVRRGVTVEERAVHVAALTRSVPVDVVATAVALLVGLAVVAFGMSPQRGVLHWAIARFAPLRRASPATFEGTRAQRLVARVRASVTGDAEATALAFAALATMALALPFGPSLFALDVDLTRAHLAALAAALVVAALSTRATMAVPTAAGVLRALARRLATELPALTGVAAAALFAGELRAASVTSAQGGAPWGWNLFHDPAMLALGSAHLASLAMFAPEARAASPRWLRAAAWALLVTRAGVASVLLLGGARVPGVEFAAQESAVGYQMLGALVLLAKTWALVAVARAVAPRVAAAHATVVTALSLRYLTPLAVMGATVVAVCEPLAREAPASAWELAALVLSMATFGACAAGLGVLAPRVVVGRS